MGKKIATGGIDFSDDEGIAFTDFFTSSLPFFRVIFFSGESEDSEGDDDDVGIGVLGATKTAAPRTGSSDGNFASRIFKFK